MRWSTIIAVLAGLAALPAYATEPCTGLTKAEFERKVLKPSDLVAIGSISDFSTNGNQDIEDTMWTKIKIDRVLKGKASNAEITIRGWQAYMMPEFGYRKDFHLLLSLKSQGDKYRLTDSDWRECVPSIIDVTKAGKVYPFIGASQDDINTHRGMTIDEFLRYIPIK